jgi:two-component system NtrC family sensor kinase
MGNKKISPVLSAHSVHDSSQTILGFIEIEVSTKKVISNLAKTRGQLIFFTIIFVLIASALTYIAIRYLIGKPVKNLVEGTKRVAQGDFKHEIPPGKAELKLLAESFNQMQKQLITTQSQLIESEKLASVGKLADEIANEINNPLTGIIVFSESLIEGKDTNENKINDYELIHRQALKIRESIKNILSLTKLNKPDFKNTNIVPVIIRAVSIVEKFSNFRNIQIIKSFTKNLPNISADPGLMEQVFLNLLLISSDSLPNGGIINISTDYFEDKKEVEINFNDAGKGISENILQQIFNPPDSFVIQNFEKTGISLTVCKDIVEMHRGKILVNSKPGTGTTVTILLPA